MLLTVLRLLQGVAVGGEWGGSVLLAMEWGSVRRRGFMASWPQLGVPLGLLLSTALVQIMSAATGPEFLAWGWRVPFLVGIVLVGVGLYVRLRVLESPEFAEVKKTRTVQYGPQAALIAESFGANIRYSDAGIGYQLASVIAGGPAPLIAAAILTGTGSSTWISVYIIGCCVISLVALVLLPRRTLEA